MSEEQAIETVEATPILVDSPTVCRHCQAERPSDQRKPCPSCSLRPHDQVKAIRVDRGDTLVVASNADEMKVAQQQMLGDLDGKIAAEEAELAEARQMERDSELAKIDSTAATKLAKRCERRLLFLRNTKRAIEAGYVLMPNLPGHVIAIRIGPKHRKQSNRYDVHNRSEAHPERADPLPAGEGIYVRPVPESTHWEHSTEKKTIEIHIGDYVEELALPTHFMKPQLIARTARALELKIFDEIVLVQDGSRVDTYAGLGSIRKQLDPIIVGRLIDARVGKRSWERKTLSFVIAWFMDTKQI